MVRQYNELKDLPLFLPNTFLDQNLELKKLLWWVWWDFPRSLLSLVSQAFMVFCTTSWDL